MNGAKSAWELKTETIAIIKNAVKVDQLIVQRRYDSKAVKIHNACISIDRVNDMKSVFYDYCPVSFIDYDELRKSVAGNALQVLYKVRYLQSRSI